MIDGGEGEGGIQSLLAQATAPGLMEARIHQAEEALLIWNAGGN